MTAEIAILNRIGVALAADSAVTVTHHRGEAKVFNSAEKLFQLRDFPVGIMIHGSGQFMDFPAEVIIKGFSAAIPDEPLPHLKDYGLRFLDYMRTELKIDRSTVIARIAEIVVERLARLKIRAEREYQLKVAEGEEVDKSTIFMAERITDLVDEQIACFKKRRNAMGLTASDLPEELQQIVHGAIEVVLGRGMLRKLDLFTEMTKLMLLKEDRLGGETGFVFAGFGEDDAFPAIYAFECDLALGNKLKMRESRDQQVTAENFALIVPFAQSEMVHRFMDGVDPDYDAFFASALRRALTSFGNHMAERLPSLDEEHEKALSAELEELRNAFVEEFKVSAIEYRTKVYRRRILDVVQFMPKPDLVEMAESLVNLTSIKQRVSAERESVGGPIDVAIVSKHDGFRWTRRKSDNPIAPTTGHHRHATAS